MAKKETSKTTSVKKPFFPKLTLFFGLAVAVLSVLHYFNILKLPSSVMVWLLFLFGLITIWLSILVSSAQERGTAIKKYL